VGENFTRGVKRGGGGARRRGALNTHGPQEKGGVSHHRNRRRGEEISVSQEATQQVSFDQKKGHTRETTPPPGFYRLDYAGAPPGE